MENPDNLREILARNLRKNRRERGFSQEKLAEKAGISTQYLAMMEIARKFPAQEVLERLAGAMEIKVYELFLIEHSPREELELLRKDIINEMSKTFSKIVEDALKCAR
ncbi:MAG: helix-turn-helix domain-containing protein [Spirochaetaceae bacterium]|jgi:transcriptional regulator with XRE-family HTH domain|nr:helix-turn-helix domain-containing protein [Spirochaetaceae bacterium]